MFVQEVRSPSRRFAGRVMGAVAVLLLAAAAIGCVNFSGVPKGPDKKVAAETASEYVRGWMTGDAALVKSSLNSDAMSALSDSYLEKWASDTAGSEYQATVTDSAYADGKASFTGEYKKAPEYADLVWKGTWSFRQDDADPTVVDVTLENGPYTEKSTMRLVAEGDKWKVAGMAAGGETATFTKKNIRSFFLDEIEDLRRPVQLSGLEVDESRGFEPQVLAFGWGIMLTNSPYRLYRIANTGTLIPLDAPSVLIDYRFAGLDGTVKAETVLVNVDGKRFGESGVSSVGPPRYVVRQGTLTQGLGDIWHRGRFKAEVIVDGKPVITVPFATR